MVEILVVGAAKGLGVLAPMAWGLKVHQDVAARPTDDPAAIVQSPEELGELRSALRDAHGLVDQRHRAATDAWRRPLSLFDERAETSANERGVPSWALACVHKAQRLIDEIAEADDLADVYETQINTAERQGRGLRRRPVEALVERLKGLAQSMEVHIPFLTAARAAFDHPPAKDGEELGSEDVMAPEAPVEAVPRESLASLVMYGEHLASLEETAGEYVLQEPAKVTAKPSMHSEVLEGCLPAGRYVTVVEVVQPPGEFRVRGRVLWDAADGMRVGYISLRNTRDGFVWARKADGYVGNWVERDRCHSVAGSELTWASGRVSQITEVAKDRFCIPREGKSTVFTELAALVPRSRTAEERSDGMLLATLAGDGKELHWSDGDVWRRQAVPAEYSEDTGQEAAERARANAEEEARNRTPLVIIEAKSRLPSAMKPGGAVGKLYMSSTQMLSASYAAGAAMLSDGVKDRAYLGAATARPNFEGWGAHKHPAPADAAAPADAEHHLDSAPAPADAA